MTVDDEAVERLVDAARAGDPEAFGSLFDRYHGPVHRYVAARACFRDNNLLATLHAQLDTIAALLARRAAGGIDAADPAGDQPADDTVTAGCGIGGR